MISRVRVWRFIAPLLPVLLAAACTTVYVQTAPPAQLLKNRHPTSIQIGKDDGGMMVLLEPRLVRDTVWGRGPTDSPGSRSGVAVRDIDWAMARGTRFDAQKTVIGLLPWVFIGWLTYGDMAHR
jgi:hypothetical protein